MTTATKEACENVLKEMSAIAAEPRNAEALRPRTLKERSDDPFGAELLDIMIDAWTRSTEILRSRRFGAATIAVTREILNEAHETVCGQVPGLCPTPKARTARGARAPAVVHPWAITAEKRTQLAAIRAEAKLERERKAAAVARRQFARAQVEQASVELEHRPSRRMLVELVNGAPIGIDPEEQDAERARASSEDEWRAAEKRARAAERRTAEQVAAERAYHRREREKNPSQEWWPGDEMRRNR